MLSMLLMSVIMYFSPLLSISVTLTIGPSWPLLSLKVLLLLLLLLISGCVLADAYNLMLIFASYYYAPWPWSSSPIGYNHWHVTARDLAI